MSSAPKKQKLVLGDKPAPLDDPDSDMDDGPALTASGRISKSAKKGGAPSADVAAVEAMMREATAAKEAKEYEAKQRKDTVALQRMALAPRLEAQYDSMPLAGGASECLVKIGLEPQAARDYLVSGPPPPWLFMLDRSDSMKQCRPGETEPAGLAVIREAFLRLPAVLEKTAGGLDTPIAFGWFGTVAELYAEGCVEGYTPWMTMRAALDGDVLTKLSAHYDATYATNIGAGMALASTAADDVRAQDDRPKASLVHVVWLTDGDATTGTTDPRQLKQDQYILSNGSATITSAIAVGCSVKHDTVNALVADSGGYYGYAPDIDAFEEQLTNAALPFAASKKPFLLDVSDSAGERRLCFGVLHPGNCERLLTLYVADKTAVGSWCGAQVGYVDDIQEGKPTSSQLMFKFCEEADWESTRVENKATASALADLAFEILYKAEVKKALGSAGAEAALEKLDALVAAETEISDAAKERVKLFRERLQARAETEVAVGFNPALSGEGAEHAQLFTQMSASYSRAASQMPSAEF